MDEKQRFFNKVKDIYSERRKERKEQVLSALPVCKEIIETDFSIDNSLEDAELIEQGVRRNIYCKGEYYFLGDPTGNIRELYNPTKDYTEIQSAFMDANQD